MICISRSRSYRWMQSTSTTNIPLLHRRSRVSRGILICELINLVHEQSCSPAEHYSSSPEPNGRRGRCSGVICTLQLGHRLDDEDALLTQSYTH